VSNQTYRCSRTTRLASDLEKTVDARDTGRHLPTSDQPAGPAEAGRSSRSGRGGRGGRAAQTTQVVVLEPDRPPGFVPIAVPKTNRTRNFALSVVSAVVFVVGVVAAVVILGGLTHTGLTSSAAQPLQPAPGPTTHRRTAAPAYSAVDTRFVREVKRTSHDFALFAGSALVRRGHQVCASLHRGDSAAAIVAATTRTGVRGHDAQALVRASVSVYCPKYRHSSHR
jgi:hypothetical protein